MFILILTHRVWDESDTDIHTVGAVGPFLSRAEFVAYLEREGYAQRFGRIDLWEKGTGGNNGDFAEPVELTAPGQPRLVEAR